MCGDRPDRGVEPPGRRLAERRQNIEQCHDFKMRSARARMPQSLRSLDGAGRNFDAVQRARAPPAPSRRPLEWAHHDRTGGCLPRYPDRGARRTGADRADLPAAHRAHGRAACRIEPGRAGQRALVRGQRAGAAGSVTGGHRDRTRSRRPDRRARGVFGDAVATVPVLGDPAARAALTRRRHRRHPPDGAAPAGASRRRPTGPAVAGGGDGGALAAAADVAAAGAGGAGHVDASAQEIDFEGVIARLVELAYTRVDMVGRRGEFAVRGGILDIFAADWPSTRCASSSGATRSPRCGCSRSPTSAPSRRSPSTRWSRSPAANCC